MGYKIETAYESAEGTPYDGMDLESVIDHIAEQQMMALNHKNTTVNGLSAVFYSPAQSGGEDIPAVCGAALFHNDVLIHFNVSAMWDNGEIIMGSDMNPGDMLIGGERAVAYAKNMLDNLLLTLTLK